MARGAADAHDKKAGRDEKKRATSEKRARRRADKEARRKAAAKRRGRGQVELGKQSTMLVLTVLLLVASIAALAAPGWGIPLGTLLGGGNQVTLTATTSDGSAPDADDVSAAAGVLQGRAERLYQKGVSVVRSGDDTLSVRVPSADDASSVASSLTGTGKFELVRLDSISDAEALAKIDGGASDVQLSEGTYTAFATNDDVKDTRVVQSQNPYASLMGGSSTIYSVGLTLDTDAANQLASITDELKDSSGKLAVVVDGTIVTAPTVSSKIEGGQVTFSGGFTQDQAYQLAAEIATKPIDVSLSAGDPEPLAAALNGRALACAMGAGIVLAVLAGLVCSRIFGDAGWLALTSVVVTVVLELGIMAVLVHFDYVILGTYELCAVALSALAAIASSVAGFVVYRSERAGGSSVRKAQQEACDRGVGRAALVEAVLCCLAIASTFLVPAVWREFAWALAAGLLADLVSMPLLKAPLLRVFTADDAEQRGATAVAFESAEGSAQEDASDAGTGEE